MRESADQIKQTGATFTPRELSYFLAEKLFSYKNSSNIRVLDPACGDGALLMAMADVLCENDKNFEIYGFDSNKEYLSVAKQNLLREGRVTNFKLSLADFLTVVDLQNEQLSLFEKDEDSINEWADLIIANPPYVRTQILGADQSKMLSQKFNLKGRVDLYYPFLIAMTHALKKDGVLGVVTSNRYLSTKSGESIRKFLVENYEVLEVIDLGDTKFFDAAVLPAIFIGKKKVNANNSESKFCKIYEELNGYKGIFNNYSSIVEILKSKKDGYFAVNDKKFKKSSGFLRFVKSKECKWTMFSKDESLWVSEIESNSKSYIKNHFKVRVGIKTTADKVFISDKWDELNENKPESELLKDLISQENINAWGSCDDKRMKILYPHFSKDGRKQSVNLEDYPKAKRYLLKYEKLLKSRKYLIDAGRNWYEIWVPQNPSFWDFPKLVFPDISVLPRFYYDDTGKLVNGNCYWIVAEEEKDKNTLLLIQGIANSKLMTKYHDLVFNNKLYSGRRRYFSQYVENYPLPDINSKESSEIIKIVKEINSSNDFSPDLLLTLEILVAKAFNVSPVFNLD